MPMPCRGWIYEIAADRLERIEPEIPSRYCEDSPPTMEWEGDAVLLRSGVRVSDLETETMRWKDGRSEAVSMQTLDTIPDPAPAGFKASDDETVMDATEDGEFVVVFVVEDCKQCGETVLLSRRRDWRLKIEDDETSGYLLDRTGDRLLTVRSGKNEQGRQAMDLVVLDLKTRRERQYALPASRSQLRAMRTLSDDRMVAAYTTEGACDPLGPSAPFAPPAGQPMPPPATSLCIAVIPADGGVSKGD